MGSIIEIIKARRSVRSFLPEALKNEDLKALAEAGILAPNAMNKQQWHFSVITNRDMIQRMSDANKCGIEKSGIDFLIQMVQKEGYHGFHHAPAVILITAKPDKFTTLDCGLAAENIVLAAQELGIGSCVLTSTEFMFAQDAELKALLGVPEDYEYVCAIALGYPADNPEQKERRRDVISYIDK